jgi:hypothetical protein
MTDNRSSHWGEADPGQPDRNDDLFAVLDGADVSEPVRAAINHALNERRGTADYVDAVLARYASERDGRRGRSIPPAIAYSRRGRYTLHLTFPAASPREARDSAAAYAEGLTILRPELVANAPLLSRADAWNHVEPLFCGAVGPGGEVCVDVPEHPGLHRAAGLGAPCWAGGDRPSQDDHSVHGVDGDSGEPDVDVDVDPRRGDR